MKLKLRPGLDYIGISTPFYSNDGKGLFVMHKRSVNCGDEQNTWDFGSGKLEFGETPEESVLRELFEEYGCKGIIQEKLPAHTIIRENDGQKTHWLVIPFFIKVNIKQVKNGDPKKISEIGFFTLNNLPKPLHTGVQFTMKKYSHVFKKYTK